MKQYYNIFYAYNAPFTIIGAIGLFLAFRNMRIPSEKAGKLINSLAGLTFGVYLLHEHVLLRHLWTSLWKVGEAYQKPWFILHLAGVVLCVYMAGSIVEWIRQILFKYIGRVLGLKRLEQKISGIDHYFNDDKKENI